jgi:hypothetical protein
MPKIVRTGPGPELDVYTMKQDGEAIGTIAIPVRDHVNSATATSLLMTDFQFLGPGQTINRLIVQGSILTLQRNECVQRMEGDWILFIDDDMVWQPDAVKRLITRFTENDLDMLGALCFRRSLPHQPTLFMREKPTAGNYNFLEDWDNGIVEVDATGMAFVVIHKRVFERIADSPMPPLEMRRNMTPPNFFRWEGSLGEDLRFCQDAKTAGNRIWVDTDIEIGHVAEITIGKREFMREMAYRTDADIATRRVINEAMGLPTVSREEALTRMENL